jgi:hypothetical protein
VKTTGLFRKKETSISQILFPGSLPLLCSAILGTSIIIWQSVHDRFSSIQWIQKNWSTKTLGTVDANLVLPPLFGSDPYLGYQIVWVAFQNDKG